MPALPREHPLPVKCAVIFENVNMRCLVIPVFCLIFSTICRARIWEIPNSTSPDKSFHLTVEAELEDAIDGAGSLEIRSTRDHQVLGTFDWYQYRRVSTEGVRVLWISDSKAFAVTVATMRSWTESFAFFKNGKEWSQIDIPEFKPNFNPADGWTDRGAGAYVASAWLKDTVLKMHFEDDIFRLSKDGNMDYLPNYWVYLQVHQNSKGLTFKVLRTKPQNP
ncbi:MAG TPA: hypothetical protein VHY22_16685 [Chthoniobacteraceae bacterium]|jgi:hypothetical protein|nr:hypothetical protein [Chthoniobacteraceae bacterium]